MNKSLRPLFNLSIQSLAYGVGAYGGQLVIYFTLPLMTRILNQQEYGAVSIITAFYTVINTLTNVGLPAATFRIYNDRNDPDYQRTTLGSSQVLFLIIASTAAVFIILFASPLSTILLGEPHFSRALQIMAVLLIFDTMNYFGNILLRLQVRPLAASIQSLIYISVQMGTAIMLIKVFDLGVNGYWMGFLFGAFIGVILMIWLNRDFIVFEISRIRIKELLAYGIPLIPTTLSLRFLRLADNFFVRKMISIEQVAVFAVGYKVGSLVNMVSVPFSTAWPNFAFTIMNRPHAKKIYRDVLTYLFTGSIFVALTVFLFRESIISLLTPDSYQNASQIVLWIGLAMVLFAIYPIMSLGPKIKKKTHHLAWVSILATLINISLNVVLIPLMGNNGVALSTLISYFCLVVFSYLVSRRLYNIPLDWRRLGKVIIAVTLTGLIVDLYFPTSEILWLTILYRLLGTLLFPLLLILFKFVPYRDFIDLYSLGRDWLIGKIRTLKSR